MCIVNRLSKEQVEEYKKGLPEEFVVYRCVKYWGIKSETLYQQEDEPYTVLPGVHEAGFYPKNRRHADYTPGFHVFREVIEAEKATIPWPFERVVPVTIRREWVQEVGDTEFGGTGVLVCDHIKVG